MPEKPKAPPLSVVILPDGGSGSRIRTSSGTSGLAITGNACENSKAVPVPPTQKPDTQQNPPPIISTDDANPDY